MRKALVVAAMMAMVGVSTSANAVELNKLPVKFGFGTAVVSELRDYHFTLSGYDVSLSRPTGMYSYVFMESKPFMVKGFGVSLRGEYGREYKNSDEVDVDTTTGSVYKGTLMVKSNIWTIGVKVKRGKFGVELAKGKVSYTSANPVWGYTATGDYNISSLAFSYDVTNHLTARVRYYNEEFKDFVDNFRDGTVDVGLEYAF